MVNFILNINYSLQNLQIKYFLIINYILLILLNLISIDKYQAENLFGKKQYMNSGFSIMQPYKNNQHLSEGYQKLKAVCQSNQDFVYLKTKLQNMTDLDEMIQLISQHAGKKQAKIIADLIYASDNKSSIQINKLDKFYAKCHKFGFKDQKLEKIKFLISKGKRQAVKRQMLVECGQKNGNQLYQYVKKDIPNVPQVPVFQSTHLKNKNGLQIRKYQSKISDHDKNKAKNVLVLGQTGCGKSTFINSLANYLLNVQIDDPFRYYLIVENQQKQSDSITQTITDYYIKNTYTGDVYRLVDTPGFGDTKGVDKDNSIVQLISQKFKNDLDVIHCVLFVMKASNTRVGPYQKYVFDSVMDLFDKTIAPNFAFIFTFSDSGVPPVLDHVKDNTKGFGKYWNSIVQPKFIKVNSCGIFQKVEAEDKINLGYWQISLLSIKSLFFKINSIEPKSMRLSKELIKKKQSLLNKISYTHQSIQSSISKRQNAKTFIKKIIQCAKSMDSNKKFQMTVREQYLDQITFDGNVTRCMSSNDCMTKNCHKGCAYSNGPEKQNCCVMKNGYCEVCGCHWSSHLNSNKAFYSKTRNKIETDQTMKRQFMKNKGDKSLSEAALSAKIQQLQDQLVKIAMATSQMESLQAELSHMQMSSNKPQSTKHYLQYLIQEQNHSKKTGYMERIRNLNEGIQQLDLHQRIIKGNFDEKKKIQIFISEIKNQFSSQIKKEIEPSNWEQIKKLFQ